MDFKELKNTKLGIPLKLMNRQLITAIVLTIIAILFFGWSYAISQEDLGEALDFSNVVASETAEENEYVSLSITEDPLLFAEYDSNSHDSKYYFLWNGSYMYVGYLDYDTYQEILKDGFQNGNYTIYGKTKKLSDDVINIAIDAYNDTYGEKFLTQNNYMNYFGYFYIDASSPLHDTAFQMLAGTIFIALAIVCYVLYFMRRGQTKKMIVSKSKTEWNKILNEIEQESTKYYKNFKLYLTDTYVIDISRSLQVFKYEDIGWMYQYELRQYGVLSQRNIVIATKKNKKKYIIANTDGIRKRSKKDVTEIMEWIASKNPDMLVGFTKENKEKAKELYDIK